MKKERALKSLYLSPIQKAKELGLVDDFGFHLLIDLKTEAYATFTAANISVNLFNQRHLRAIEKEVKLRKIVDSANSIICMRCYRVFKI